MSISVVGSVVLIMSVICFVECDTNVKVSAPQKNPDHPNKCWDEATQTAYSVGSHNPKESCQRIHCYPDFRIKHTSCGTHSAAQGYSIEQDLSKDYPDCCAKLVKLEKKAKRVDLIESSAVKISKFRSRAKAVEVPKEKKTEETPVEKVTVELPKAKKTQEKPLRKNAATTTTTTTAATPKEEQPKEQTSEQPKVQLTEKSE